MSDTTEPTYDVTHRPCLILDLPELSDEAAWQLSEFLQTLAEHIDAHYSAQISRAYRAPRMRARTALPGTRPRRSAAAASLR